MMGHIGDAAMFVVEEEAGEKSQSAMACVDAQQR
jgi:hypothetical protein